MRIDSNLLAAAESGDPNATRKEAAEELRRIVSTVGRAGAPGAQVRCVVSVKNMLSEGWDANNVTHILGLRAFGSQLLCEQVVGRGLWRMDYTPDPATGRQTEEYVDIFGVPFSLIPFKGRPPGDPPPPDDRPKHEVLSMPERAALEMRFPVVEGFVVDLQRHLVCCDVDAVERIRLDPWNTPTAAFVRPQVGYAVGSPGTQSGFGFDEVNREAYYRNMHLQTIAFEIAREVVRQLVETAHAGAESLRITGRAVLFPQDQLELNVPYEFYGQPHVYEPDFIVRLRNGLQMLLEVKGQSLAETEAKHQAAKRWVSAVNHWGQLGRWHFHVCWDPQKLAAALKPLAAIPVG